MHELSIAMALLEQVGRHTPMGATVRSVQVRAGPLRAIDPDAMQFAWQAAILGSTFDGATLNFDVSPWKWRCLECGRTFESDAINEPCSCGAMPSVHIGSDELTLLSLDVEDSGDLPPRSRKQGDGDQKNHGKRKSQKMAAPIGH